MKFPSEFILQRITRNNLDLFGLDFVAFEFQYAGQRFDTLAFDKKTKSFIIIEYKNKLDFNVINQGERYYNLLLENKEVYIEKYNDVFNTDFKESYFDFDETKVMMIGPKFSAEQIEAHNTPTYPFELWKVSLNENYEVIYENLKTNEIKKLKIDQKDLELTENDLLENKSEKVNELYRDLINRTLNEFPNVKKHIMIDAFTLKVNENTICRINILNSSLNVYFYTNTEFYTDKNVKYDLKLTSEKDFDYFIKPFKQVYDEKSLI